MEVNRIAPLDQRIDNEPFRDRKLSQPHNYFTSTSAEMTRSKNEICLMFRKVLISVISI